MFSQYGGVHFNDGNRKYLNKHEIDLFTLEASRRPVEIMTFCGMLALTGCRISEALELRRCCIDLVSGQVAFRCLKKRRVDVFRAVPLPPDYVEVMRHWLRASEDPQAKLWPWSRMTGYRHVVEVMRAASVVGRFASPKGLRHGFGVRALQSGIPITLVQRWLGHADIKTTAIYTHVLGAEEREIAARMWGGQQWPVRDSAALEEIKVT